MGINNYGKIEQGRRKKLKRRITAIVIIAVALLVCVGIIGVLAGDTEGYRTSVASIRENHELREQIADLEEQIGELQQQIADRDEYINAIPTIAPTPYAPQISEIPAPTEAVGALESPRD